MPRYKKARDRGTLSPSQIDTLRTAKNDIVANSRAALRQQRIAQEKMKLREQGVLSPTEIEQLNVGSLPRDFGSMSPQEIRSRGFKYFPDNP